MPENHSSTSSPTFLALIVKIIHYAAVAVLVLGACLLSLDEASVAESHRR